VSKGLGYSPLSKSQGVKKLRGNIVAIALLAAAYFITGKLGLRVAFVHASSTAVWAPTGIAIAALLMRGYGVWPGAFLGAFLVNVTTAGSIATSLGIATGNTLEGVVGALLVNRYAHGSHCFDRAQDTFKFAILAGLLSPALAATFGVTSLALGAFASWESYRAIWLTWWLGDAGGAFIVAPFLILWASAGRMRWRWSEFAEFAALLGCLVLLGQIVFGGFFAAGAKNYPLEYLCIPVLIWVAFRFHQREAATATLVLSAIATWGTLRGFGPFVGGSRNEALLLLQAFVDVVAVTTMGIAGLSAERQRAEERAVHLSVTDSLTGLANYRKLVEVLDAEIKRSGRTGRLFAVLLLDVDGLKSINDRYGHQTGSRALCRVADVLRSSCRGIDTPARLGGDEFAVVIPESGEEAAQQVARRIQEGLKGDRERPPVSVSMGAGVYPQMGETIEAVLGAADRALYAMKRSHR
jgi:diguanylate cyclase (GGDEF)-like protein